MSPLKAVTIVGVVHKTLAGAQPDTQRGAEGNPPLTSPGPFGGERCGAVTDHVRHCLGLAPEVEPGHGAARTARGPGSEREILVGYHDQRLCAFGGRGLIAATGWTV
jgi:hypothetical protein